MLEAVDSEFGRFIPTFVAERRVGDAAWHERIRSGRADDVVDATVLATTAKHCHPSYAVLPADVEREDTPVVVSPGEAR